MPVHVGELHTRREPEWMLRQRAAEARARAEWLRRRVSAEAFDD